VMTGRIIRAGMPGQSERQTQGADHDAAGRKRLPACGAKNRRGEPCRVTSVPGKRRCRFHGGLSTGPKTVEGKARIAAAQRRRWARGRGDDMRTEKSSAVPPVRMSPDQICGLVAQEPEVREAAVRWDRATPSTHRDLVRARLATQARLGIPAAERAPLYSGEVEDFLVPVMIRMGRGEEGAVVVELRKALMRLYGEFGETVLTFMLKTYRHHSTEALLGAARATAP
jgi:hypothetical protein